MENNHSGVNVTDHLVLICRPSVFKNLHVFKNLCKRFNNVPFKKLWNYLTDGVSTIDFVL